MTFLSRSIGQEQGVTNSIGSGIKGVGIRQTNSSSRYVNMCMCESHITTCFTKVYSLGDAWLRDFFNVGAVMIITHVTINLVIRFTDL